MKKLLMSVIAATAILFGFAGCSGDLHDSEVGALYLVGELDRGADGETNVRIPMTYKTADTSADASIQKHTFKYDSTKMKGWGGGSGELHFKIVLSGDENDWSTQWGAEKDQKLNLVMNAKDFVSTDRNGPKNGDPGHIILTDLADGVEYTIWVKYDAPLETVDVRVTGAATDYPNLKLVTSDGKDLILTRTGSTYIYSFTETTAGKLNFYVSNGYMIWTPDTDGKEVSSAYTVSEPEFEKESSKNFSFSYEANKEYEITVTAEKLPEIKVLGSPAIVDLTGFAARGVNDEWNMTYSLEKQADGTWKTEFTAKSTETLCKIANEDWSKSYSSDVTKTNSTKEDNIGVIEVGKGAVTMDDRDSGTANPTIKGLSVGKTYVITVTPLKNKISVSVAEK